jgi:hypothetical protein
MEPPAAGYSGAPPRGSPAAYFAPARSSSRTISP